jgi:hypothetical protein
MGHAQTGEDNISMDAQTERPTMRGAGMQVPGARI